MKHTENMAEWNGIKIENTLLIETEKKNVRSILFYQRKEEMKARKSMDGKENTLFACTGSEEKLWKFIKHSFTRNRFIHPNLTKKADLEKSLQ